MNGIPYVVGQWVRGEKFYDRREHIEEILHGPRNSIWVLGTRRIGKTSLLKRLEEITWNEEPRVYFPVFWDLQGAESQEELHQDFQDSLLDAEERLEVLGIDRESLESKDLFSTVTRLRRELRARSLRLLLLCDEVEQLIQLSEREPALLTKLRRTLQSHDDVRSVLTSTIRLWALADQRADTSPFLHGFAPPIYLRALPDDDARALVRQSQLPKQNRPELDEEAVEIIRERCDNHPYLLQLVAKRYLENGNLEEAIAEVAADRMVSYFFSVDFEMLSDSEREILQQVAEQSEATSRTLAQTLSFDSETVSSGLLRLENLGFMRRNAERRFVIANYFFRRWLSDPSTASPISSMPQPGSAGSAASTALIADRYELARKVGEGATGVVYHAFDRSLGTDVALKLLRPEFALNEEALERFRQEIVLSRDIGHPNVLRIYDLGEFAGSKYLTMQWVQGPSLARVIRDEAPLPAGTVAAIGCKLAAALTAIHSQGVVHRDIKPHNVLMHRRRRPLVTDFGLARSIDAPGITQTGMFLGTPAYVSPEQAALQPTDARSDLYSLGVVLFEMTTGRRPFTNESTADVLRMQREEKPRDPRQLQPELPDQLAEIILRCLEKHPADRFATAAALGAALEPLVEEEEEATRSRVTSVLSRMGGTASDRPAADALLPEVYDELRRLAGAYLAHERRDHTLQPTALVHEAYLKLVDQSQVDWQGRTHFLAVGALAMRRLLVDHARKRGRAKRGGGVRPITLDERVTPFDRPDLSFEELLTLEDALEKLRRLDERQARIVELRYFSGLTVEEVAKLLGVSKRTVESDWTAARDWLRRELE